MRGVSPKLTPPENTLAPAVIKAFHHFWYDADLQEHFLQSWIRVAQRFGDHPAVLGYEVLNEPFFGDISPLRFEKDVLYPFYRRIAEGLHSVDPDCVVFFEPMIITNVGLPSMGSPIGLANTVYAPHFYQAEVHEGHPYNGDPTLINNTMKMRRREATKHKTPWILTEFGVAPATPAWDQYIEHLLSALDEHSAGWCYWSYDKGGERGFNMLWEDGTESPLVDYLVRPYPQRTAGHLKSYRFDPDNRLFEMVFENRGGVDGETEIFVAASRVYEGTFHVECSDPPGTWSYTFDPGREIIRLQTNPDLSEHIVRITP